MNLFPRFSIGFRFSLIRQPQPSSADCWRMLLSRIPAEMVVGASLHECLDNHRHLPEDAILCALGDLSLASGKRLCAQCLQDAVLHSYLTYYHPIIQNNEMLLLGRENYAHVGVVSEDGTIANGTSATQGLRFCGEIFDMTEKRERVLLAYDPFCRAENADKPGPGLLSTLGTQAPHWQIEPFCLPLSGAGLMDAYVTAYNGRYESVPLPHAEMPVSYGVLPNRTVLLDGEKLQAESIAPIREAICQNGYRTVAVATSDADDPFYRSLIDAFLLKAKRCGQVIIAAAEPVQHMPHASVLYQACRDASIENVLSVCTDPNQP